MIDFNPFYEITDALLYCWFDICKLIDEKKESIMNHKLDIDDIECRYIDNNKEKRIEFQANSQYRYPIDAVDLSNEDKIREFIESQTNLS